MVKKRSGECEGPFAQTTGPAELWPWPQHSNGYHTGARHCGMERDRVLGREGSVIHHNSEIKSRMTMEGRSIVSFRRQGTFKPDRPDLCPAVGLGTVPEVRNVAPGPALTSADCVPICKSHQSSEQHVLSPSNASVTYACSQGCSEHQRRVEI